jgi:beta-N-acetylhexosaminidase
MESEVGELVWAFIKSTDQIASVEAAARAGRIGGIWLLRTEMNSPGETAALINRIQTTSRHPLLVGVDAESGLGHVMGGATELPNAMAQGATGNPAYARAAAQVTAVEAAACGINVVAAPVLDVNSNPSNPIINTRSYGEDPTLVAQMGTAYIEGTSAADTGMSRVVPIGKHFPGHGDTSQDSHLQLGEVSASLSRLQEFELQPFRAAIAADVPLLMTAHVGYPALDPSGAPATLSHPILTGLLREQLVFRGAVVTDALDMYAIAHNFAPGDAALDAVLAGNDLLLTDQFVLVYDALADAVQSGTLPEKRVHEALERVRAVRTRVFGSPSSFPERVDSDAADRSVGTPANEGVADRIAAASMTLVDGDAALIGDRPLLLVTHMTGWPRVSVEPRLRGALTSTAWHGVDLLMLDAAPNSDQVAAAVAKAATAGSVALLHFNGVMSYDPDAVGASPELAAMANAIVDAGARLTVVSLGSPYALSRFPRAHARLCSYSTCAASVRAVVRVLNGTAPAPGHLPVHLDESPAEAWRGNPAN